MNYHERIVGVGTRKNIILTGIPRSGTTLAASLIDSAANGVCLNEPRWQRPNPALDASGFARAVLADFHKIRRKILAGEPVEDRRGEDGNALTNYYSENGSEIFKLSGFTRSGLTPDFTLAVKHNASYLAVLPQLAAMGEFEIIAVVRHPLPVIRSWRRLNLPINRGKLPGATPYWPELREITESGIDLLEMQAKIYALMLARINKYKDRIKIINYEELVKEVGSDPAMFPSNRRSEEDEAITKAIEKDVFFEEVSNCCWSQIKKVIE